MDDEPQPRFCRVEQVLGRREICPEAGCPFWDVGEEERQNHCSLEGVDFQGREQFAEWLHDRRREFGDGEHDSIRSEFFRRLNEGRSD
jgi:hypothetical protein